MIQASGLRKTYPDGTTALRGLDLHVAEGEMVFIRGRSGAGKTTLFRLILGMEDPTEGDLRVAERTMGGGDARSLRDLRRKMGVIFQDFRLIKGRSSRENIEMGIRVLGITGSEMRSKADELLQRLDLVHRANTPVESLSWGERQRVATARALSREPSLVLADEPTGNLDSDLSTHVIELLREANDRGATVLIATHAADILAVNRHRTITLAEGLLVSDIPGPRAGSDELG